ncbi:DUF1003 domain-containing protein [Terrabacter sp. MAHUQ-38]|nr:DUF1003 domain-containing protein [Terrabacter sp. MAHUQ-38]
MDPPNLTSRRATRQHATPELGTRPETDRRHPVVDAEQRNRSASPHLRLADRITRFAGSMPFVYIHAGVFAVWMVVFERSPWPTLTLVVSLEAIFLSTFVMIGQNRQAAFQQAKADHDFQESELELKTNTELTRQIHALTTVLYQHMVRTAEGSQQEVGARGSAPSAPTGQGQGRPWSGNGPADLRPPVVNEGEREHHDR